MLFQSTCYLFAELWFVKEKRESLESSKLGGEHRTKTCVFAKTLRSGRPLQMEKNGFVEDIEGLLPGTWWWVVSFVFHRFFLTFLPMSQCLKTHLISSKLTIAVKEPMLKLWMVVKEINESEWKIWKYGSLAFPLVLISPNCCRCLLKTKIYIFCFLNIGFSAPAV